MSDNDYADLRALAEAATPGPWLSSHNITAGTWDVSVLYSNGIGVVIADMRKREADSAYIAAVNPARILALLADLDAARRAVWASEEIDRRAGMLAGVQAERDALAAKVEALTKQVALIREASTTDELDDFAARVAINALCRSGEPVPADAAAFGIVLAESLRLRKDGTP